MKPSSFITRGASKLKRLYHYHVLDRQLVQANLRFLEHTFSGGAVLFCILHTKKTSNRVAYLKAYYDRKVDFVFYSDYEHLSENVIKVSHADDYHSNELKHINMLNLISRSALPDRYRMFYFLDDDTFVNLENLLSFIDETATLKRAWIGSAISSKTNSENLIFNRFPGLVYMSGGAGYLLTADLFGGTKFRNHFSGFSDVSLGVDLQQAGGVSLINDDRFHSQPPVFYDHSPEAVQMAFSYHYIKTKEDFLQCAALVRHVEAPVDKGVRN